MDQGADRMNAKLRERIIERALDQGHFEPGSVQDRMWKVIEILVREEVKE